LIYGIIILCIFLLSIGVLAILNKGINSKIIKEYLQNVLWKITDFIWIPILYYLIKIFEYDKNVTIISKIKIYGRYILITFMALIITELFIKYRTSKLKYLNTVMRYLNYGVAIFILMDLMSKSIWESKWSIMLMLLINCREVTNEINKEINRKKNKQNRMCECNCSTYEELFPSRKEQADNIISYIDSYGDKDRFTLLINENWGSGKTSLIKGVEEKCKNKYDMIFIQPMLFDKKELLIKYFCEMLKEILGRGNVYTGKGSSIEKYLESLLLWINKKSTINFVEAIFNEKSNGDFRNIKEELQNDIYKYNSKGKKIIVIVDDFDRVEKETVKEVLMFTREIIDFQGVNIILLMQYSKITDEIITKEYLDKYLDKRIDLVKVSEEEIISTFIEWAIEEEKEKSQLIKDNLLKFRKELQVFIIEIKELIENPLNEYDNIIYKNNGKDQEAIKKTKESKEKYDKLIADIKESKDNIRLIKKIVKEFVNTYAKIQSNNQEKLLTLDDIKFIFKILIVKNVFVEEYCEIQKYKESKEYFEYIYFGINAQQKCMRSLLCEITAKSRYSLDVINRYKLVDAIKSLNFKDIKYETKQEHEIIITNIDETDNLLNNKEKFVDKFIKSSDQLVDNFEYLFRSIFGDYYSNKMYIKLKERLEKINNFLIEIVDDYDFIDEEILLRVYELISKNYERYEMNYILIKAIYIKIKNIDRTNYKKEDFDKINRYIVNIRGNNINSFSSIVRFISDVEGNEKELDISNYLDLNEINKVLSETFQLNVRLRNEPLITLENILYEIRKDVLKDKFNDYNKLYLYTNITKFIMLEKILKRIQKCIESSIDPIKTFNANMRLYIEYSDNYNDFYKVSNQLIEEMINNEYKLTYSDFNNCYGIINKCSSFIHERTMDEIIWGLQKISKKFQSNMYQRDYNYLDTQRLQLNIEKLIVKRNCSNNR